MKVSVSLQNSFNLHKISTFAAGVQKQMHVPTKSNCFGSSVSGGEMLLVAIATCYCNDIYREAAKRNITIHAVQVTVEADFGAEGEPGTNFRYKPVVSADAGEEEILQLLKHTDTIAEIHNTLRKGATVTLDV